MARLISIQTAEVAGKSIDEAGRAIVEISAKMSNQDGTTLATAKSVVELPKR